MFVSAVVFTVALSGSLAPEAPPAQGVAPPSTSAPDPGPLAPPGPSAPPAEVPATPPSEGAPSLTPPAAAPPAATPPEAAPPADATPKVAAPPVLPPVAGDQVGPPGDAPPPSGASVESVAAQEGSPIDVEVADDVTEAWATDEAETEMEPRPAPPPPPVAPPAMPADGQKMLIAGGVIGGLGLLSRVLTTAFGVRAAREPGPPGPMAVEQVGAVFFTPLIATGMGLVGGAMGRRGRVDAHRELFEGGTPRWKRRLRLGWGLFGAGMGVWAITRLTPLSCRGDTHCSFRHYEVGYYISLAGTIPGIVMGAYASGYREYRRRNKHFASVSAAPMITRNMAGLSLSGRF